MLPEFFRFPHDVDGWLSEAEGRALAEWAAGKNVLEIGSYCGRSTICIAQTAKHVVSVDPHDGRGTPKPRDTWQKFCDNLYMYAAWNVKPYHGTITEVAPTLLEEQFQLIFIDGAHDYASVANDIRWALRLLAPDGLLVFHDYRFGQAKQGYDPDVERAVNELLAKGWEIVAREEAACLVRYGEKTMLKTMKAAPTCGQCRHWHAQEVDPAQRLVDASHGIKRGACQRFPPQYTSLPIQGGQMVNTLSYPIVPNGYAACAEFCEATPQIETA